MDSHIRRLLRRTALPALVFGLLAGVAGALAATPPDDFEELTLASGLRTVTDVDFAPDGRVFIAEKRGFVRVIGADGQLDPQPVIDISGHVNNHTDRGLLGIAVDSDFADNGYLYLLYVLETDAFNPTGPKRSRLTRIVVRPDNSVENPSSPETVILGKYTPPPLDGEACPAPDNAVDCIPADSPSHAIGTVRSDVDGTLWVGTGDANSHSANKQNSFRAYDERSYAGKILHVDRNGRALPGHPFCPGNASLDAVCAKIHAAGFRNPFRFTLRPGGEGPIVGDVGEAQREEIDIVEGGRSYGWPCYEGDVRNPAVSQTARCQQEYAKEGAPDAHAAPTWSYPHLPEGGGGVIAGPLYTGSQFPAEYRNTIFVGDFVQRWVKRLVLDEHNRVARVEDFATDWFGVDLEQAPSGEVVYADLVAGEVNAFAYAPLNQRPAAKASADRTHGPVPLTVRFTGSESSDPDGDELVYHWDFGDGSAGSSDPDPVHEYQAAGAYTARLTVRDPDGAVGIAEIEIQPGNEPPAVTIESPAAGSTYRDGVPVTLRGAADDPQDGALSGDSLRWEVVLHHNTHVHPFGEFEGGEAEFTPIEDHDADSFYEIRLIATDGGALSSERRVDIQPETVRLTFASDPPGAPIAYGGVERTAPYTTTSAIGFQTDISAASDFTAADGLRYVFDHWSDGGEQVHAITVPAEDTTLTATYRLERDPPETTITQSPLLLTLEARPQFKFNANEPVTFECRVDSGEWTRCFSGYRTPPLAGGQHTVAVRATDRSGNTDPTPASVSFFVIPLL